MDVLSSCSREDFEAALSASQSFRRPSRLETTGDEMSRRALAGIAKAPATASHRQPLLNQRLWMRKGAGRQICLCCVMLCGAARPRFSRVYSFTGIARRMGTSSIASQLGRLWHDTRFSSGIEFRVSGFEKAKAGRMESSKGQGLIPAAKFPDVPRHRAKDLLPALAARLLCMCEAAPNKRKEPPAGRRGVWLVIAIRESGMAPAGHLKGHDGTPCVGEKVDRQRSMLPRFLRDLDFAVCCGMGWAGLVWYGLYGRAGGVCFRALCHRDVWYLAGWVEALSGKPRASGDAA
ncbi:unnamed protein product [Diplocarpon coronariae]